MFYYLPILEIHGIQLYQGRHHKEAVLSRSTSDKDRQKSGLTGIYVRKADSSVTRVFILKEHSYLKIATGQSVGAVIFEPTS